jgi:uncharacterized membrane protein YhaH (DUF805 family)
MNGEKRNAYWWIILKWILDIMYWTVPAKNGNQHWVVNMVMNPWVLYHVAKFLSSCTLDASEEGFTDKVSNR